MALLDFLGRNVGGNAFDTSVQGPQSGAGTGPTYGDIAKAALQYGSKPGSSGSMFGQMIGQQYGQQGKPITVANALQPLADQPGSIMPQKQGGSDIWGWILSLIGI